MTKISTSFCWEFYERKIAVNHRYLFESMVKVLYFELHSVEGLKLLNILNEMTFKIFHEVNSLYQPLIYDEFGIDDYFLEIGSNFSLEYFCIKTKQNFSELQNEIQFLKENLPENANSERIFFFNLFDFSKSEKGIFDSYKKNFNLHSILSYYLLTKSVQF